MRAEFAVFLYNNVETMAQGHFVERIEVPAKNLRIEITFAKLSQFVQVLAESLSKLYTAWPMLECLSYMVFFVRRG